MRRLGIISLLVLGLAGMAFGQKSKIKEGVPATSDSLQSVPDSLQAQEAAGKAAIRGGLLMNASRDSLRAAAMAAPSDVVDTFGVDKVADGKSYLHATEIDKAHNRIKDIREQLEDAENQLELAKAEKRFSLAEITAAQEKLDAQKARLKLAEDKLVAIRDDWEAVTGINIRSEPEKPDSSPPTK